MGVPGIIVARTDAEAATLLDGRGDERDQPFILGATNVDLPAYKVVLPGAAAALPRRWASTELNGHLLYAISDEEYAAADAWLERTGLARARRRGRRRRYARDGDVDVDAAFDEVASRFVEAWEAEAGLETYGEAVADVLEFRAERGRDARDERRASGATFASAASFYAAREKARALGVDIIWDCELAKTPEGYYQVARRHRLRDRQVARRGAVRRPPLDGDQDRRPRRRAASSPRRSTPSSPTRCSPTTCRRRSTGTRPG